MEIQFLGAAREVTGSCYLIHAGGRRILVDCGLIQGSAADEVRNREPFPFDPTRIDAVVLSHAHLDHSGRIPLLVKAGFRGPIYTQRATRDLCRIMLKDAGHLNEKDAQWENRKRQRKGSPLVEPLYTLAEAEAAMRYFKVLDYGVTQEILPGIRVRLRDAGHILGSAIVELWLQEGDLARKLVFSGDLGHRGAPVLRNPEAVGEADLVLLESTYGDRQHRSWEDTWAELAEVLGQAERERGNVLVPAFAVGRTQELLYIFGRRYEDWDIGRWTIFLDSPMAIEATAVYARHWQLFDTEATEAYRRTRNPFELPNLHYSHSSTQSMAINRIQSGAMIIAGSGMCNGGRIKHHLKHNIWREHSHVIITGFQARGTLGRALVDGATHIRLWGEVVRVAAKIHTIGGLSAHADQAGLLDWYAHFDERPPVALVHGEPEAMDILAQRLRDDYEATVLTPAPDTRLDLRNLPPRAPARPAAVEH
ncbi:MAG: MBL fold metallo-hydrolase RNA specificity domain-containing protein [Pseudomonadota bacterium]